MGLSYSLGAQLNSSALHVSVMRDDFLNALPEVVRFSLLDALRVPRDPRIENPERNPSYERSRPCLAFSNKGTSFNAIL